MTISANSINLVKISLTIYIYKFIHYNQTIARQVKKKNTAKYIKKKS